MRDATLSIPASGGPLAELAQRGTFVRLVVGGALGLFVWELWARILTPLVLGFPLEPAGLLDALFQHNLGLAVPRLLREAIHYAIGLLGYPVAYFLVSRLVPRWGVVLDLVVLVTFTAAIAGLVRSGTFQPVHFIFWTAVVGLIASRLINRDAAIADAISWGNFTWFNALGIFAPLGGLSFYALGDSGELSYMSFVGHTVYGAIAAWWFERGRAGR